MTLEDNLRFLADRVEDGKPFLIDDVEYVFDKDVLRIGEFASNIKFDAIKFADLKLKPMWEFTEDEKVILRNLEDKWNWIARDENGMLHLYDEKPYKVDRIWAFTPHNFMSFSCFNHLFQSIQWEDGEPCEFREYI